MSVGKGLLLSCIVLMYVSLMACLPNWEHMNGLELALCNLKKAENDYVKLMFNRNPTNLEPPLEALEGITFGNTTEEIEASICSIRDYLGKHLPAIIRTLTQHQDILRHTKAFLHQFNSAVQRSRDPNEVGVPEQCHRNVTTSDDYTKKRTGLLIIYSTRRWVEIFIGTNTSCL